MCSSSTTRAMTRRRRTAGSLRRRTRSTSGSRKSARRSSPSTSTSTCPCPRSRRSGTGSRLSRPSELNSPWAINHAIATTAYGWIRLPFDVGGQCASGLRVDGLACLQHCDELREPARSRLRPLRVLEAVQDRIAVLTAELGEERLRLWAGVEFALKVIGDDDPALALVGRLPSPITLRPLDFGEPGRTHLPGSDQSLHLLAVDPRPPAPRLSRRESLAKVPLVEPLSPPVDPPEAESAVQHFGVAHARDPGVLLGDLDPHARGGGVVALQPFLPLALGRERQAGKAVVARHAPRLANAPQ